MEVPSFSTAQTILAHARDETLIGSNPISGALQDADFIQHLSDYNSEFVNWPYSQGMRSWKFLRKEYAFKSYGATSCVANVAVNATTFQLTDGTNFDSPSSALGAGYFKMGSMTYIPITYQTKTGNVPATLTGVNGVTIAQTALTEFHKMYTVPSDVGKVRFLALDNVQYMYVDPDMRQIPYAGQWTWKYFNDGTYPASFLVLPYAIGNHDCVLYYMQSPTTISAVTQKVQAPDGHGRRFLVESLKSHIWETIGEWDLSNASKQAAQREVQMCADQWATHVIEMNSSVSFFW